jgi:hypothetical protein
VNSEQSFKQKGTVPLLLRVEEFTMNEWAREKIADLDRLWDRYWPYIQGLTGEQFNTRLPEGRTVKEVLAHIAFWEEAAVGFVRTVIRGENIPEGEWYGGSDLMLKEGDPWPRADVHNAREAKWAQSQSNEAVLKRMERARTQLIELLQTVTPEEAEGLVGEFYRDGEDRSKHFEEHMPEILRLVKSDK